MCEHSDKEVPLIQFSQEYRYYSFVNDEKNNIINHKYV